jgi:lactate 2-monooxygenase
VSSRPGVGLQRQTEIYLAGVRGQRPQIPFDYEKLDRLARSRMSPEAYAYVAGGAGAERTIAANRAALDRWKIVPRVLRDVSDRDLSVELLGRRRPTPFLIAPIGVLELAHKDADIGVGKAAAAEGVPVIFSNQASRPMEQVATAMDEGTRWFQLYWSTSDELVASFVGRAEACGCEAIVVTLDTKMLGWRSRDLDFAHLPFATGMGIAQYTSDPVFRRIIATEPAELGPDEQPKPTPQALKTLVQLTRAYPDKFVSGLRSGHARSAVQTFVRIYANPALTWEKLPLLREMTKLPVLLKGVLHPDDASRAVDEGIDGIIVSNHGGRQVDGATSTIEALPGIARAVDGRIPIVLDSGIRSGADAFKALALGATAVGLGRPYAYGLAIAGEAGVREVLQNFKADFDLTLGLSGCTSVADIGPERLTSPSGGSSPRSPRVSYAD